MERLTGNQRVVGSIPVRDSEVFSSEKKEACDNKNNSFTTFIQAAKLSFSYKYCYLNINCNLLRNQIITWHVMDAILGVDY